MKNYIEYLVGVVELDGEFWCELETKNSFEASEFLLDKLAKYPNKQWKIFKKTVEFTEWV